jgi:glycosyltransferase involved in cell wall biosynthesis
MPLLSVIIPVYNESKTISQVIDKIQSVDLEKEIIVIDDNSTDGTDRILREIRFPNLKIIRHATNRGKGAAFSTGLMQVKGKYVIAQDADLEYDPQDYLKLVNYAEQNNSIAVFGSRFLITRKVTGLFHYLVNYFLTFLTNLLFGSKLTDMETCYKLIRTDILKELKLSACGFELEPEITTKLLKRGYQIREVAISYNPRNYSTGKKINCKDGFAALFFLVKARFYQ